MSNKEFFDRAGDHYVQVRLHGDSFVDFTVEEMYQQFKCRIIEELRFNGSCNSGVVYGRLENGW